MHPHFKPTNGFAVGLVLPCVNASAGRKEPLLELLHAPSTDKDEEDEDEDGVHAQSPSLSPLFSVQTTTLALQQEQ